jgi:RHS repeat-associated protein
MTSGLYCSILSTAYTAAYSGTDNGERTTLKTGSTTTVFHNGPEGLADTTTSGTDTGFIRDPQGTLNSMRTGGSSYYYLTDAQGSVLGLVDAVGRRTATYTYDPLGKARTTTQTVPQPYRFQGTYLDPSGLYKMGARYYDPTLGRFTQTDPSGKETNPYLALGADPVNHIDPNGTFSLGKFLEGTGAAAVAVGSAAAAVATASACTTIVGCAPTIVSGGTAIGSLGASIDFYSEAF